MMHKFNSLDLNFAVVWSQFEKNKNLQELENNLKSLAIAGQPNALAKWYQYFNIGDYPQIDEKMNSIETNSCYHLIAKGFYEKQLSCNGKQRSLYHDHFRSAIKLAYNQHLKEDVDVNKPCSLAVFCDALLSYTTALKNESAFETKRRTLHNHLYKIICTDIFDFNKKYQSLSLKGGEESYPQFAFSYATVLSTFLKLGPHYEKFAQTEESIYLKLASMGMEDSSCKQ